MTMKKILLWVLLVVSLSVLGASLFGALPNEELFKFDVSSLSILGAGAAVLGLLWVYLPTNMQAGGNLSSSQISPDLTSLMIILKDIKDGLGKNAAAVEKMQNYLNSLPTHLRNLENAVGEKAATHALRALQDSELGSLRNKLADQQRSLDLSQSEKAALQGTLDAEIANSRGSRQEVESLRTQLLSANDARVTSEREVQRVNAELQDHIARARTADEKVNAKEVECEGLRSEAKKAFGNLAPQSLGGWEVSDAVRLVYSEAVTGDTAAVSTFSVLAAFGAAQSDPSAKDFQLQIVRRLGVVLVQYWKQKGLSEKERHDQLSVWAKCLNEHADGRFNLFVPGLGTPIDRTRMSCATSATTVHEVLCWQVRNPAGVNFSLAEVA